MGTPPRRLSRVGGTAAGLLLSLFWIPCAHAQTGANVAVVINENSAASRQIGEHYARKRGLPDSNIITIRAPAEELINRAQYVTTIERPIAVVLGERGLQDRILYLVLTKGVPLRIAGTAGVTGLAASVDSELTLLYRRMTGRSASIVGRVDNPYYLGAAPVRDAKPFSRRDHDIYLVTRLDAFTVEEALSLIDRAQAPSTDGRILLDRRGDPGGAVGDLWLAETASRVHALGQGDRVDLVETLSASASDPVLGYYSWGSNDPANRRRRLGIRFGSGALAATLSGTDARTFGSPPEGWEPQADSRDRTKRFADGTQSVIGDLIRDGVTGVAGNVTEPLLASAIRPQVLFPAYLSGLNLAESFYLALPHLSWQGVIVGDPLCRPFERKILTAAEIEDPVDEQTGLPGLFSNRRIEVVRAKLPGAPPGVLAPIVRAEAKFAAGKKDEGRGILEEVTVAAPDLAEPHLQLAITYEQEANFPAAIERYRRVLELQPRNVMALNNLAYRLALDHKAAAEALPLARKAAALTPRDPKVIDTLGWIHYLLGNYGEAAKFLGEAVRGDPGTAETQLHAALAFFAVGSYKSAETHLNEAVRLNGEYDSRDDVRDLRAKLQKKR